jgi:hypothetical protein
VFINYACYNKKFYMNCSLYETFEQGYPNKSVRFKMIFDAVENLTELPTEEKAEKFLRDVLIDAFPGKFTINQAGNLTASNFDTQNADGFVSMINDTVVKHYGFAGTTASPNLIISTYPNPNRATNATPKELGFNTRYFKDNVLPKNQIAVSKDNVEKVQQAIKDAKGQFMIPFDQVPPKESRQLNKDLPFTTIPTIKQQVTELIDAFQLAGVNLRIKFDPKISSKGQVVRVSENTADIVLNPVIMTEDTHIHEFSHILVDLLGEDNPIVKKAIAEIKDTYLYDSVAKAYPELEGIALDKEVLVTAMGIAGAKSNTKNPSKIQVIVNRLLRAIKNLFGINDSAVEQLVNKLLSKSFTKEELVGDIESQESKTLDKKAEDFKNLIADASILLQSELNRLESLPNKSNEVVVEMKYQLKLIKEVKKVEDFIKFVDYIEKITKINDEAINKIRRSNISSLTEEERLETIHELYVLGNNLKDFFASSASNKSLMDKLKNVILDTTDTLEVNELTPKLEKRLEKLSAIEQKITNLIGKASRQQKLYNDFGIELMADLLLQYHIPEIDSQLDSLIENVRTNRRLVTLKRDEEYDNLTEQYKTKKLTEQEYKDALIELNIKQLSNKKVTRETLVNQLREAQIDKSAYSYMMDPIIYSSQVSLQMFASHLKNKLYQASDDTREIVDDLAPIYREFAAIKGNDLDPRKFNEDILETHSYYVLDNNSGYRKEIQLLSFVQPYDSGKYYKAEHDIKRTLREKYQMPNMYKDYEVFKTWRESDNGKNYYKDLHKWYNSNTVPTEQGTALLNSLRVKFREAKAKAAKYENVNPDRAALYEAEKLDILGQISRIYDYNTKTFKGIAVRPNELYLNPKYQALMNNAPAKKYYEALLDQYQESQKLVGNQTPVKNEWDSFAYVLPSIEAEGIERLQKDNYNVFKASKDYFQRGFQFLSTDDSYGAVINANKEQRNKIIPVHYITPTDAKYVSHDVGSTIILFAGMANMFKRKSEIVGSVIMMRDIIERREIIDVNAANIPIVSSVAKQVGVHRNSRKVNEISNNFKHLEEFIDRVFFNEEEIRQEFKTKLGTISANKLVSKLSTFTALNSLAFNFLQAGNQFLIDNQKIAEESIAGQFFNMKNATWGKSTYLTEITTGGALNDIGKFNNNSKLARFVQEFDLLGDALDSYKQDLTGNRAIKMLDFNNLFFLQKMAEHETAVTRGLALADSYRGKLKDKDGNVIKNEKGEDANLYDLYTKDEKTGKWSLDPRVANFKKIQFANLVSGVYKKTNQIKTKFDDPMLNRRWYGNALLLFRRYFQPGLRKRWGYGDGIHLDTETGHLTEGMYVSFGRYVKEVAKGGFKFGSIFNMMEDFEKANVKRTTAELSTMLACIAIVALLSSASDNDDDEEYWKPYFAYQSRRMQSELEQYWNPIELYRFILSPSATLRPIVDAADLMQHLMFQELPYRVGIADEEGVYYENSTGANKKGDLKTLAKAKKITPLLRGAEQSRTPEEAIKFFDLGAATK